MIYGMAKGIRTRENIARSLEPGYKRMVVVMENKLFKSFH